MLLTQMPLVAFFYDFFFAYYATPIPMEKWFKRVTVIVLMYLLLFLFFLLLLIQSVNFKSSEWGCPELG